MYGRDLPSAAVEQLVMALDAVAAVRQPRALQAATPLVDALHHSLTHAEALPSSVLVRAAASIMHIYHTATHGRHVQQHVARLVAAAALPQDVRGRGRSRLLLMVDSCRPHLVDKARAAQREHTGKLVQDWRAVMGVGAEVVAALLARWAALLESQNTQPPDSDIQVRSNAIC